MCAVDVVRAAVDVVRAAVPVAESVGLSFFIFMIAFMLLTVFLSHVTNIHVSHVE